MITASDLGVFVDSRMGTRLGDANLDGLVNFEDFLSLSANFGRDFRDWARGDFDCDQIVGFEDFLHLSRNFGFSAEVTLGDAVAVPEPNGCGIALMGSFILGLTFRRLLKTTSRLNQGNANQNVSAA